MQSRSEVGARDEVLDHRNKAPVDLADIDRRHLVPDPDLPVEGFATLPMLLPPGWTVGAFQSAIKQEAISS
jgi:hypothetical protein